MTALKDVLTQVADEARLYDGTERAVRALRRRRAAVRLAPVAAALLVVAGVAASTLALGRDSESGPTSTAGGLPTLLSPARSAPDLPADRAVGPASLAYVRRAHIEDSGELRLVTTDGRHFVLPGAERLVGISPDGRWVLWAMANRRVVLRDLTGTQRHEFGPNSADGAVVATWSPDSKRLVLVILHRPASDANDRLIVMINLDPLAQRTVPLDADDRVCAVRNSGELVLCPPADSWWTKLRLADGVTGRVTRTIELERIGPLSGRFVLRPDDATMVVPARDGNDPWPSLAPNRLVAIDLDTGRVTARYPLPELAPVYSRKEADGSVTYGEQDRRALGGAPVDGVLLVHISPRADDPMSGRVVAIEMVAPDTGELTVVTRVSGDTAGIYLRGEGH
jgi:hypothetical protein